MWFKRHVTALHLLLVDHANLLRLQFPIHQRLTDQVRQINIHAAFSCWCLLERLFRESHSWLWLLVLVVLVRMELVVVSLWHGSRGVMVLGMVVGVWVVVCLRMVIALPVALWMWVRVVGLAISVVRVSGRSWCTFVTLVDRIGIRLGLVVHWSR